MNIESFFPGRLRVSSKLFAHQENLDRLKEHVGAMEGIGAGIKEISGNLRTGSVTVLYDPEIISVQMLMNAKAELEKFEQEL